jgi:hypothetical protein
VVDLPRFLSSAVFFFNLAHSTAANVPRSLLGILVKGNTTTISEIQRAKHKKTEKAFN